MSARQETLEWSYPVTAGSQCAEKGSGYQLIQWQQKVEPTFAIFSALGNIVLSQGLSQCLCFCMDCHFWSHIKSSENLFSFVLIHSSVLSYIMEDRVNEMRGASSFMQKWSATPCTSTAISFFSTMWMPHLICLSTADLIPSCWLKYNFGCFTYYYKKHSFTSTSENQGSSMYKTF